MFLAFVIDTALQSIVNCQQMTYDTAPLSLMHQVPQTSEETAPALSSSPEHSFPNPVRYRNMAEQIASTIRDAIATGSLPFGSRLLEAKIAREMGTSRGPVREALFRLEREGLVVRTPNRETSVVGLTEEVVRQIASLRGVLEGFAAQLAVRRLTEGEFDLLERIIAEMSSAARAGNFEALVECDYQFHEHIVRASGHPLLHETWIGLQRRIRIYLSALNRRYGDMNAVVKGHVAILRALRRRDIKRLNCIMPDHMVEALDSTAIAAPRHHRPVGPNDSVRSSDTPLAPLAPERRRTPKGPRTRTQAKVVRTISDSE